MNTDSLRSPVFAWTLLALATLVPAARAGRLADFSLSSAQGDRVSLYASDEDVRVTVIAYTGLQCPNARLYLPRLVELEKRYRDQGVRFLAINPNPQDDPADVMAREEEVGQEFPTLMDPLHIVTDRLGVTRTTEVIVCSQTYIERYRGAVDDQYALGARKPQPHENYLIDAIDAILSRKRVGVARTDAPGCKIGPGLASGKEAPFSYYRDVAPILAANCVECHRPGQVGPMSLLDPETVRGFAGMIAEVAADRRMPPWYADRRHGSFLNERGLSMTEIAILERWADDDAPLGDAADGAPPPEFDDAGWNIEEPDVVVMIPDPIELPATGVIPYQYAMIDPGIEEDTWVQAVEIRPSNRKTAHHMLAAIVPKEVSDEEALDKENWGRFFEGGYFAIFVPGARPHVYPVGMAKKIPAGARFLLEMHYTATGAPEVDQAEIGIRFAREPVTTEVQTVGIFFVPLEIEPGVANDTYSSEVKFARPIRVLAMFPHMHLRGKSFRFEVKRREEAASKILLSVPKYDPYWQEFYRPRVAPVLDAGDWIRIVATFDNSEGNPNNPDPTATVTWGWQETEEMMAGYIDFVVVD